ncbi:MAG: hypothetical protein JNK05_17735 [Myxococcales bacterium]|nr:hypothetical protein [Myxococcales bacterium]
MARRTILDPRGRFARCSRCQWLDHASQRSCAQCGAPFGHESLRSIAEVDLAIEHADATLSQCTVAQLEALRAACAAPPREFDATTRRALEACDGRCVLVAADERSWRRAAIAIVEALAHFRGPVRVACLGSNGLRDASSEAGIASCDAPWDVVVSDRALSLDREGRNAIAASRYCVLGDLETTVASIEQAYSMYSLVAQDALGSRRSFVARFRGADAAPSARDAELGALLAPHTVWSDDHERDVAAPVDRAPLVRWLDAAPRS